MLFLCGDRNVDIFVGKLPAHRQKSLKCDATIDEAILVMSIEPKTKSPALSISEISGLVRMNLKIFLAHSFSLPSSRILSITMGRQARDGL